MCTVLRLKSASKEKSQVLQIVHNPPAASCDRPSAILVSLFEMGFLEELSGNNGKCFMFCTVKQTHANFVFFPTN